MKQGSDETSAEWMSAREALELVSSRNGSVDARQSIATRASAGLLSTRASIFIQEQAAPRGEKQLIKSDNIELPSEFWWAKGGQALSQDWATGDFSTWIDSKFEWQAFGVRFERNAIEAMLAPEPQHTHQHVANDASLDRPQSKVDILQPSIKSRQLTHNHPYAAAKAILELIDLPLSERDRLNAPSVGRTMSQFYRLNGGKCPHDDNLEDYADSVLRALREHWQN